MVIWWVTITSNDGRNRSSVVWVSESLSCWGSRTVVGYYLVRSATKQERAFADEIEGEHQKRGLNKQTNAT
jgi:hypothetical protein